MPRPYLKATRAQILTRATLLATRPKKYTPQTHALKNPNLPRFYKIHTKFNQLQILSHTPAPVTLLAKNKNFKILILLKLPQTHAKI